MNTLRGPHLRLDDGPRALSAADVPEIAILPGQWRAQAKYGPLERLALAVMISALRDARLPKLRREVRKWMLRGDSTAPLPFAYICEILGLDVAMARRALLALMAGEVRAAKRKCRWR